MTDSPRVGRPTDYNPSYCKDAERLCSIMGATDDDLARFFDVSISTIKNWRARHPEFMAATKKGKEVADDRVEDRLFHRAMGYSYDAVKIFMPAGADEPVYAPYVEHVPPDTGAAIFWLKNRRGWRDKVDTEHTGSVTYNICTGVPRGGEE